MKINKINFFNNARLKLGSFNKNQVNGFDLIIDYFEKLKLENKDFLAYILATVWHECNKTMQPIEEYGKGLGKPYGKKIKMSKQLYNLPNKIYYGRGYVQLTWYENYELMGKLLKLDLLKQPELALIPENAIKIMFEGMLKGNSSFGDFTGKSLEMYFNNKICDPVNARKIINGTDKAELIANYFYIFKESLL